MNAGDDTVTVGVAGEAGNSASFQSTILVDGGQGNDTFDVLANGNTFVVLPVVKNVETLI